MSGSVFPVGHRTSVGFTIPILSQASPLEGLPPSQDAFQEHAAHSAGCSALLNSKGSSGTLYTRGCFHHSYMPLARRTREIQEVEMTSCSLTHIRGLLWVRVTDV